MQRFRQTATALLLGLFGTGAVMAQGLFVYPANGQSLEQQAQDERECQTWATQRTGFDPNLPPPASGGQAPSQVDTGSNVAKGALGGAVGGLIIGNVAGGSGSTGALAGGLLGGAMGGIRSSRQRRDEEDRHRRQQQAQASNYNAARAEFLRAYSTCLEGRGYTVN